MDETNGREDGLQPEGQKNEKPWKRYAPEEYAQTIADLVHFSSKTVNSNASLVGVRLAESDALDAPYVSARTLMARKVSLSLDYGKGGAALAGICKQINAVLRDTPFSRHASPEEREAIGTAMAQARASAFSTGTEYVDHRLRQLLIPREGQDDGYVAMTPITAGGVCELLFDRENGLVSLHNAAVEEARKASEKAETPKASQASGENGPAEKEAEKGKASSQPGQAKKKTAPIRKIRQAQFGIGGSNPQNVGGLVRVMQRPLFVDAPRGRHTLRAAFSCFHKGIKLDFALSGPLRATLSGYMLFRSEQGLTGEDVSESVKATNLVTRREEEALLKKVADAVLEIAQDTRNMLEEYAPHLPGEVHPETGRAVRVSSCVRPRAIRGLLEPAWREAGWPRDMAWHVVDAMKSAWIVLPDTGREQAQKERLVLDATASATVAGILEDCFR